MSKIETLCIQGGWQPKNGEPRVLPIYQSTTFKYETTNDMADLFDLKARFQHLRIRRPLHQHFRYLRRHEQSLFCDHEEARHRMHVR